LEMLTRRYREGASTFLSSITAWELGFLFSKGRLRSSRTPFEYFRHMVSLPGVRLTEVTPELFLTSHFLPGQPPNDPADRILVATAREHGYVLVTRDAALLEYAAEGHLQALAC